MSLTAAHESKRARRICQCCRKRKARFQYRGRVRADRDHVLCFECYRSERERRRAKLSAVAAPGMLESLLSRPALTTREIAHRRRMLQHLRTAAEAR